MRRTKKDKLYFLGGLNSAIASNMANTQGLSQGVGAAGMVSGLLPEGSKGAGAVSGATQGAQLGMIGGPIGMGVGAVLGGAAGFLKAGKEQEEAQRQEFVGDIQNRNKMLGINTLADGGRLDPKDFTGRYIQSPKYKERLESSGYDTEKEILERLENLQGVSTYGQYGAPSLLKQVDFKLQGRPFTTHGGSSFLPSENAVVIDHKQAEKYGLPPSSVEAHEYGHVETGVDGVVYDKNTGIRNSRLNKSDTQQIINRLKSSANPRYKKVPDEIKSDMNALRYELFDKGIYDAGKEDFNQDLLNKSGDSYIKERLGRSYEDEDLIWLMNNIAKTNNKTLGIMAANGGKLTEFNNGGSHEKNIYSGIPQGMAPDGSTNKVEEGETKWEDYIFSDRLKVDNRLANYHNIPTKFIGNSFADISKKVSEQHKERPNDPISRDTTKAYMSTLMAANDDARIIKETNENVKMINKAAKEGAPIMQGQEMANGGFIAPMGVPNNTMFNYKDGGGIHIDPSKKGTFSAQATKMGMGIQEAASKILNAPEGRYSPAMRKKANFAKNFAKADGGKLYADGSLLELMGTDLDPYVESNVPQSPLGLAPMNILSDAGVANLQAQSRTAEPLGTKIGDMFRGSDVDAKALRYAPIAFNALAGTGLFGKSPKPEEYTPTTIQQPGSLKAQQLDVEPARAAVDQAYQTGIRSLAGATGGSGAALRANLQGLNLGYTKGLGQTYLGAQERNLSNVQGVDQFNLQNQQQTTAANAQLMNQAGLYNTQAGNQYAAQGYDDRMSYLGAAAEGLGDIGYEERNREILPKIFGYSDLGEYRPLGTRKACGGRLRK